MKLFLILAALVAVCAQWPAFSPFMGGYSPFWPSSTVSPNNGYAPQFSSSPFASYYGSSSFNYGPSPFNYGRSSSFGPPYQPSNLRPSYTTFSSGYAPNLNPTFGSSPYGFSAYGRNILPSATRTSTTLSSIFGSGATRLSSAVVRPSASATATTAITETSPFGGFRVNDENKSDTKGSKNKKSGSDNSFGVPLFAGFRTDTSGSEDCDTADAAAMVVSFTASGQSESNCLNAGESYCIGRDEDCKDNTKSITVTLGLATPGAISLTGTAEKVTASAVAYTAARYISASAARAVSDAIETVGLSGVGLNSASVTLSASGGALSGGTSFVLSLVGSPSFTATAKDCNNFFECSMVQASGSIQLGKTFTIDSTSFTGKYSFGVSPITVERDQLYIQVDDKTGPNTYMQVKYSVNEPTPEIEFGVATGFKFCVEDCNSESRKYITLIGTLAVIGGTVPLEIGGTLSVVGTWYNALGTNMLHISDITAGVRLTVTYPPVPTAVTLGATICLGLKAVCDGKGSENFIKGLAYGGVDFSNPDENFFVAMLSEFTFEKIFAVLGDTVDSMFHSAVNSLPQAIRDTGLKPVDGSCTAAQTADPTNYPNCFARVAYAIKSGKKVETSTGTLTVPQGFSLSARFNFLGYELTSEATISPTRFYLSTVMDPINMNGFQLTYSQSDKSRGPQFLLDLQESQQIVQLNGFIDISILESSAAVSVLMTTEKLEFQAALTLFGVFSADVMYSWSWTGTSSSFSANLQVGDFGDVLTSVFNSLQSLVNEASEGLTTLTSDISKLTNAINDPCSKLDIPNDIKSACNALAGAVMDPVKEILKLAKAAINTAKSAMNSILSAALNGLGIGDGLSNLLALHSFSISGSIDASTTSVAFASALDLTFLGVRIQPSFSINMKNVAGALWSYLKSTAAPKLASLVQDMLNKFNDVKNSATDALSDAVKAVENAVTAAAEAAAEAAAKAAAEAAAAAAKAAEDAANALAGTNENDVWCTSSGSTNKCCKNGNHKFASKENACKSGISGKVRRIYGQCKWENNGNYCCKSSNDQKKC